MSGIKIKNITVNMENIFTYSTTRNVYKEYVIDIQSVEEENVIIQFKESEKKEHDITIDKLNKYFEIF